MTITSPSGMLRAEPRPMLGPRLVFGVAAAASLALLALVAQRLAPGAFLPALSTLLFGLAAVAAVMGWRRPANVTARLSYWDVAGILVLIGIAVAALIEPEQLVRIVAGADRNS